MFQDRKKPPINCNVNALTRRKKYSVDAKRKILHDMMSSLGDCTDTYLWLENQLQWIIRYRIPGIMVLRCIVETRLIYNFSNCFIYLM